MGLQCCCVRAKQPVACVVTDDLLVTPTRSNRLTPSENETVFDTVTFRHANPNAVRLTPVTWDGKMISSNCPMRTRVVNGHVYELTFGDCVSNCAITYSLDVREILPRKPIEHIETHDCISLSFIAPLGSLSRHVTLVARDRSRIELPEAHICPSNTLAVEIHDRASIGLRSVVVRAVEIMQNRPASLTGFISCESIRNTGEYYPKVEHCRILRRTDSQAAIEVHPQYSLSYISE